MQVGSTANRESRSPLDRFYCGSSCVQASGEKDTRNACLTSVVLLGGMPLTCCLSGVPPTWNYDWQLWQAFVLEKMKRSDAARSCSCVCDICSTLPDDCCCLAQRSTRSVCACRQGEERRSEEHTSELQSLMRISYAVVCLKKK